MKPHPTKSKPRKAKPKNRKDTLGRELTVSSAKIFGMFDASEAKPRQPGKGARVMWASYFNAYTSPLVLDDEQHEADRRIPSAIDEAVPVLVLDLSPEARERRVEVAAQAMCGPVKWAKAHETWRDVYRDDARAVLLAIGDTPAREGRGK